MKIRPKTMMRSSYSCELIIAKSLLADVLYPLYTIC